MTNVSEKMAALYAASQKVAGDVRQAIQNPVPHPPPEPPPPDPPAPSPPQPSLPSRTNWLPWAVLAGGALLVLVMANRKPEMPPPLSSAIAPAPSVFVERPATNAAPIATPATSPSYDSNVSADRGRVSVPTINWGDKWTFETSYRDQTELNNRTERRVIDVSADRFTLESKNLRSGYLRQIQYTKEWNVISTLGASGEGSNYSPPIRYFDFPLYEGKTWNAESTETDIRTGSTRQHRIVGHVGGWDTVTTSAGTFTALKVVLNIELRDESGSLLKTSTDTSWYAPTANRSVRSVIDVVDVAKGDGDHQIVDVVEYSVSR